MRFAEGIWLYVVPLVPVVWLLMKWGDRRSQAGLRNLLGPRAEQHVEGRRPRVQTWDRFLLLLAIFWILIAAARPQWGASEVTVAQRGSDVVVALDISNSMLAEDVVPNRMGRAKAELDAFFKRLQDSRVGLVFFAGSAFVQCPLTRDYGTAQIFLDMAGPDMLSEQGTAIAAALQTAHDLLLRGRGDQTPGFQAILLVTDGEDLEGNWEAVAKKCLDDGIRIIPVGVGSSEGGLIPVTDDKGRAAGFMKDMDGNVVMSRLDMASLQKMAAMGGGSAFRIGVDGMAGDRLFGELEKLGKREFEERQISAYQERYLWPALLALACLFMRFILYVRFPGRNFSSAAMVVALMGMLALGNVSTARSALVPPAAENMAKGRSSYLQEDYETALSEFGAALVHNPDNPRISLALGEALSRLKKYDEAVREFGRTMELTDDPELQSEALYNAGTTLLAAGKPDEAVAKLREALAQNPGQDDALWNLEQALTLLKEQQNQQQQNQQQDKNKQDKNQQDQNKEQQSQQDKQDQQKQDQQGQDQNQQDQQPSTDQQQQENGDPQKDKPKPSDENLQQKADQDSSSEGLDKEHALQILKAMDRDEQELKRSVQKRLKGGKPRSGKRW